MGHHPQRERPHALARFIEVHACRARRASGGRHSPLAGPIRHPAQRTTLRRLRPAA
jgi:hypothetical protein